MFKKKHERLKHGHCFSYGCAEKIEQMAERVSSRTFLLHICKHHPEMAKLEPCKAFRATRDEAVAIKGDMMKSCSCGKLKKVV